MDSLDNYQVLPCRMIGYENPCVDCPLELCAFGTGSPGNDEYENRKNNYI
jgi:hypothetical protein